MGKKNSGDEKKVAKESAKAEASSKADKAAQDQYWDDAGEGSKTKSKAKREDADKTKQEAAAKKLETKRLAEAEEAAMQNGKTKAAKASSSMSNAAAANAAAKMTAFQLAQQKEADARERESEAKEREMGAKREVTEEDYGKLVESQNINRREDGDEARTLEAALSVLGVKEDAEKHPEKRMRGAWAAYEAANLKELREDRPGLKLNQYKDMLWKMWQKAPENPMNQANR